jgi:hypothetical protein
VDSGYAEFNDSTSKLRGFMVAGQGTFSGAFSADNIDAVSHINVRDWAVSTYVGFSFPTNVSSIAFSVPAQEGTSVADISVPLSIWTTARSYAGSEIPGWVTVSKNGSALSTSYISAFPRLAAFPQVVRFIDTELTGLSHYQVQIAGGQSRFSDLHVRFIGTVTVGFRKR